ncbi:1,4-alpha-glucan branching enzyme [Salegentibacter salinarum]|uniref:1,4-alpha-glucan branching enzyme n=1 Tax=Salegentibacter salinarum TaxID=447422 RepID=A0A2N0TNA4_9FLAO|nr:hypothetical protein [Salegentibacter salinarum]PKD16207.1 1,4-alpha-glucan branching enzyme [Salegentibacter salinarum]SKB67934.1 hypothetical protein SAMN05660903_02005 [Salegentibacter salinarum]
MSESKKTKDHQEIKEWVEERKGKPALVKSNENTGTADGLLRIKFSKDQSEENLETITWPKFFTIFDENRLEFLYQDETKEGNTSRFFKFVRT